MKRRVRYLAFAFVVMAFASACDSRRSVTSRTDAPNVPPQKVTVPAGKSVRVDWAFPAPAGSKPVRLLLQRPPGAADEHVKGQPRTATYEMDPNSSWELDISGKILVPDGPIPRFRSSTTNNVTTYDYAMDDKYSPILLTVSVTLLPP